MTQWSVTTCSEIEVQHPAILGSRRPQLKTFYQAMNGPVKSMEHLLVNFDVTDMFCMSLTSFQSLHPSLAMTHNYVQDALYVLILDEPGARF